MSKAKPVSLHWSAWVLALSFSVGLPVAPAQTGSKKKGEYLAPYVPTPMPVVEKMLELAKLTKDDVVYDLGCGDGRIVVHAAAKYGARGVGVDYDPVRVAEANAEVLKAKVQDRVTILEHDAMTVDISPATVVTLYLLPDSNRKLKPRPVSKLHGTRANVVKHVVFSK